jgi:hypothetical protein
MLLVMQTLILSMPAFGVACIHRGADNAAAHALTDKSSISSTPSTMELMEDVEGFCIRRGDSV